MMVPHDKIGSRTLGLYIHSPFCKHKCGYCDFNSWAEQRLEPQKLWLEGIVKQFRFWGEKLQGTDYKINTVFWGGGTPSLLDHGVMLEVSSQLNRCFNLSQGYEWTIECNPETLSLEKLRVFKNMGVTRLSMGIQSFQDHYLQRLERQVSSLQNMKVLDLVASHWIGPWSLDLMFALPGQTLKEWEEDLDQGMRFSPSHLSAYQLTLSTARSKAWKQADEDELEKFYTFTCERVKNFGLNRYEISNFSKPGEECRHNLKYWRLEPFLAVGPGGAGVLGGDILREMSPGLSRFGAHQKNPDSFEAWLAGAGRDEAAWLNLRSSKDHLFELLMMGLRLDEGLSENRLKDPSVERALKAAQDLELIDKNKGFWRATERGKLILQTLLEKLYAEMGGGLDSEKIDPTFI